MTSPLSSDLARARAEWLAGDAEAWTRYTSSLRRLADQIAERDRPRPARRPRRTLRPSRSRAAA